jgi:hypothetical protein
MDDVTIQVSPDELVGTVDDEKGYPREESNLTLDLRRVVCFQHTPRICTRGSR